MKYVIGVDQGSSKTVAVVSDCMGNILGFGSSKGACYVSTGMEYAMNKVSEACQIALNQAGLDRVEVDYFVGGLTGADWPHEYNLLENAIHRVLGIKNVVVYNDCIIAMRGGTNKKSGAVICAGSGLNSAIIAPDGTEYIYGYYIEEGDSGGSALGKKAIGAVYAAETGIGSQTFLTELVLDYLHFSSVNDLLFKVTSKEFSLDVKALTPLLFRAADREDKVAVKIIEDFGTSISRYVTAGLKRFHMLDETVDVVLSGGIFKDKNLILLNTVSRAIKEKATRAKIINAKYEPVIGAALMALDKINDDGTTCEIEKNIRVSSSKFALIRISD